MALINCAECKKEVSDLAASCPHCGAPVSVRPPAATQSQGGGGWWKWLLGVPVGGFILLMIIGSCAADPAKQSERSAIDLCWQEQKRKSLDPGSARFVAGACERMEANFLAKHGVRP